MKTQLLKGMALVFAILFTAQCSLFDKRTQTEGLAILQGMTTPTQTEIIVLANKKTQPIYSYSVQGEDRPQHSLNARVFQRTFSPWQIHHLFVDNLKLDEKYVLYVKSKDGTILDRRSFSPLNLKKQRGKFAVASCMDDQYTGSELNIWKDLLSHQPDLLFLIGDNVYADKHKNNWGPASPEQLWNRYVETRNVLPVFRQQRLIPTISVWDDHDYGMNNGDRTYPHKEEAQRVFDAFFGGRQFKGYLERGPGVSKWLQAFGQNLFFLDDRSFRTPNNKDIPNQTHFGAEQNSWLIKSVLSSPQPTWIISGDQFFGGYHNFESFEGNHPREFKTLMKQIGRFPVPVVFVSGDRHLAEIMKVKPDGWNYKTYEITTSGIHAKVFPGSLSKTPNSRQIFGVDGTHNYAVIETLPVKSKISAKIAIFGPKGETLDERTLSIAK